MTRESKPARAALPWAAVVGVVAAAVLLAVAEVLALVFTPGGGPIVAVGAFVIDIVPRPLKEFAISTFGEADKPVLLVGLGVAVLVAAAVTGALQYVRRPLGAAGIRELSDTCREKMEAKLAELDGKLGHRPAA